MKSVAKNITISVSDDIASQMDALQDVNWSAVAKNCIKRYIELRQKPDLSILLSKLEKEKGEEYVRGRTKADEIVLQLGYAKFNLLMKKYWKKLDELTEFEATGGASSLPPWESMPDEYDALRDLLVEKNLIEGEISQAFLKGLRDRFKQVDNALAK